MLGLPPAAPSAHAEPEAEEGRVGPDEPVRETTCDFYTNKPNKNGVFAVRETTLVFALL